MADTSRPVTGQSVPRFNETAWAIIGSFVLSVVLATLLTGNPFRAMVLAYTDYSNTPAAGAPPADTVNAPADLRPNTQK